MASGSAASRPIIDADNRPHAVGHLLPRRRQPWRPGRVLAAGRRPGGSRGETVRLWVDDPLALHWMAPDHGAARRASPSCAGPSRCPTCAPGEVVIEAFGCDPPASFVRRMARAGRRCGSTSSTSAPRTTSSAATACRRAARRDSDQMVLLPRLHAGQRRPAARAACTAAGGRHRGTTWTSGRTPASVASACSPTPTRRSRPCSTCSTTSRRCC